MAGDKNHRLRMIAVCQRYAAVSGATGRGGDARHHLKRYALRRQGGDLFATAAENKRVTTLETHNALAFPCQAHQQRVDLILPECVIVFFLVDIKMLDVK